MGEEVTTSLYELNKASMLNIEPLSEKGVDKQLHKVCKDMSKWHYGMLLSMERRDYTLFYIDGASVREIYTEVSETLENRGTIIDIFKATFVDDAWEIWIKDVNEDGEDEAYVYYMFDYSNGVINCKAGGVYYG